MMMDAADRLARLRAALADTGLDGWYVGREDMFQGEEVPPSEERLAFVSGFSGSAGHAVILQDAAALFSDGRYTLQMANQSDPDLWSTHTLPEASLSTWLQAAGAPGKRIGVDPQLVTVAGFRCLEQACRDAGAELVAHADNPLDAVWGTERPQRGATRPFRMLDPVAGQSMSDKLAALDTRLADAGADAVVISRVDAVNWLVNIRGNDLANTPVNLIFALYHRENGLLLLGDLAGLAPVMEGDLVQQAAVVALDQFDELIQPRAGYDAGTVICFEPTSLPQSMFAPLTASDARLVEADCAVTAMKAVKNSAELAGTRRAHVEDGAVMVRFLHWLSEGGADGMTETAIAAHLLTLRQTSPRFIASSFDAICGSGPNGAIVHYRAVAGQDRALQQDSLLLVDSGAHYNDGTTDITRTMAIGAPDAEMRHAFTAVLRAHIAVARARFPAGTAGQQIDALARAPMWANGLDYAHGTGHGVGHVLQVHEGPASISKRGSKPLMPGMLLSNEPGYYKAGAWGIRTETLVVVTAPDADGFSGFETVTLCPIDRRLIDVAALLADERRWLDDYHTDVRDKLMPELAGETACLAWLEAACAPL